MKKMKMEKVKLLYIIFLFILFLELLGSLGAVFFAESSIIRDAGITNTFLVVITTIVILIPWIVESRYKIDIPDFLEVILLSMLFISVVLGFLNDYYVNVKGFDKFTHILSGITLLVVWEFYEFIADTISYILDNNTLRNMQRYQWINDSLIFPQGYGLYDTMVDLFVGTLGALVVVVVGYLLIKNKSNVIKQTK